VGQGLEDGATSNFREQYQSLRHQREKELVKKKHHKKDQSRDIYCET